MDDYGLAAHLELIEEEEVEERRQLIDFYLFGHDGEFSVVMAQESEQEQ